MKVSVKAVVRATAQMLGIADEVEAYLNNEETQEGKRCTELLLKCFNHVENELALDYLPLLAEDEVVASTGIVKYAELVYPAVRVFCVEDGEGNSLKYKLFPDCLETHPGKVKVVYSYSPTEKSLDMESDYQTAASERLFLYGMAAEYCLAEGELESAGIWDKKYKEAIAAAYRLRPVKRLRSRRWV